MALFALTLASSTRLSAQVLYGSIVGTVQDPSGAAIPGASVTATQVETGETRSAVTNGSGSYEITTVPAGTYSVSIDKPGFARFDVGQVQVTINTVVRVNASMRVGSQAETVNITAGGENQLQTDTVDVHGVISDQQLQDLPQPTTTYEGLIGELPGAAPPQASSGGTNNPARSMSISMNGTSNEGTNVAIEGVAATNPWVQYNSTAVPSSEAIETVNVTSATPSADQGAVNGASIRVQIKSGTNQFHGEAYEFNENNAMEAKPYFNPVGQRNPKYIDNDVGANIGGPILRDKLFFFGSWEGEYTRQASGSFYSLPTPNMVQGILASNTPIFDPATGNADGSGRQTFPTDAQGRYIIPAGRIDPIAAKLLPDVPAGVPEGVYANNLYINTPQSYNLQKIDTKLDWNASQAVKVVGRFSDYPYSQFQAPPLGQILQDGGTNAYGNIYAISGSVTYIKSAHLVYDATFGLTHTLQNLQPPLSNVRYGADTLGIPNTNLGPLPTAGGVPQFQFNGLSQWGYGYPALVYNDPVFEYVGNGTWIKGNHSIRFGIDVSQQHMNHQEVNPTYFNFSGGLTGLYCPTNSTDPRCANGSPSTSVFNSFADYLLGLPQNEGNNELTVNWATLRTWQFSPYVQDTWQVTPKLTAYYGTAWNYFPTPTRTDHGIEYFNPANGVYQVCGVGNSTCNYTVQKDLFAPRVGAAYRVNDKTVVRAGYSLAPEQINMARDGLYNYPINLNQSLQGANSYVAAATLEQGFPALAVPNVNAGTIPLPGTVQVETPERNFIRGYTESENLAFEHDFGWNTIAQISYVGSLTVHMHSRYDSNYGLPGGGQASQVMYNYTTSAEGGGFTSTENTILPLNHTNYQSLQATLDKHFSNGLQFHVAYTWSHHAGVCCQTNGDGGPAISDPAFFYLNYATMPDDIKHHLETTELYQLPFGKNGYFLKRGIGGNILGGWELNSVVSFYSGSVFGVSSSGNSLDAPGNSQQANQVKPHVAIYGFHGINSPYFDTTAFAPVTTPTFGTAKFDNLRGPSYFNIDANVLRTFPIRESLRLQVRAQALNVFNHPNFGTPDSGVTDSNFGTINSTNPGDRLIAQRYLRIGAKLMF